MNESNGTAPATVVLAIQWTPQTGQVAFQLPPDRLIAYGMLGMAVEALQKQGQQPGPGIVVPKLRMTQ